MEDKKKLAAAISAVFGYIKTQEELAASQAAAAMPKPQESVKLWGVSARQAMMQMRNLMQFRTYVGSKFR